jgi:hypothetical protein
MNPKAVLSKIVGVTQTVVGGVIMLFAFFIFYNIFNLQTALGFPAESIGLYLWTFILFGLLSAISGMLLLYEP